MSGAVFISPFTDKVGIPRWLSDAFKDKPEAPDTTPPTPVPGRDDREPLPHVSQVFGLTDPTVPTKLSGVGPVFWDRAGQGNATLTAVGIVLNTGHLFAERGKWRVPRGQAASAS